jgi:hypothetical protein
LREKVSPKATDEGTPGIARVASSPAGRREPLIRLAMLATFSRKGRRGASHVPGDALNHKSYDGYRRTSRRKA